MAPRPTILTIVRHGQTAANAAGLLLGRADPPLTDLGRRQARAIADALRGVSADPHPHEVERVP